MNWPNLPAGIGAWWPMVVLMWTIGSGVDFTFSESLLTGQSTERAKPQHRQAFLLSQSPLSPRWSWRWPGDPVLNEFTFPGTFREDLLTLLNNNKKLKKKKKIHEGNTHIKPPALSHKPWLCVALLLGTSGSTAFMSHDRHGGTGRTDDQNLTFLRNYKVNLSQYKYINFVNRKKKQILILNSQILENTVVATKGLRLLVFLCPSFHILNTPLKGL